VEAAHLRIGELSRRSGVSPELLRAWEHRYGLLRPTRSDGGFRLYSTEDERRVAAMRSHLERGLSAAEAARVTLSEGTAPEAPVLERSAGDLRAALDAFEESAAQAALDRLLSAFSVELVLVEVVLPYLRELGDRWERGDASIAQEHFASHVLRGRLLGLARGWDRGAGPRAVLACMPGEQHDLGLIAFGLALRDRGWRIVFLGPDTPLDTLTDVAATLRPDAVVLSATTPDHFERGRDAVRHLARAPSVHIAGAGATPEAAEATGARPLGPDPIAAADRLAVPAGAG
jgi:MerR family transcriptional regulator, light-induced transcriptional regulator